MYGSMVTVVVGLMALLLTAGEGMAAPFQSCEAPRYVRTNSVGAEDREYADIVRTDGMGRIITAGMFGDSFRPPGYTVDFDFTEGVDEHVLFGGKDTFVTVMNADGSYAWTNTFGGNADETVFDVAVDAHGMLYVVGYFGKPPFLEERVTADFDPGPGKDIRACKRDSLCSYVTTYSADGEYLGTWTNGAKGGSIGVHRVVFDGNGNMFLAGRFMGRMDFDPGEGEDFHESGVNGLSYVTKLLPDRGYEWTITFDWGLYVHEIGIDGDGNLYVAGEFFSSRRYDFDPGPGEDWHGGNSRGEKAYITRINADLSYGWTRMIARADTSDLRVEDLEVDGDGVYLAGSFSDYVEFDPDGSPDPRTDDHAAWLVKLDRGGRFQWTHVLVGDDGSSTGRSVSADGRGGVYFAGTFGDTINFDPDGEGDWLYGPGSTATFVSKLGSDKSYHWTGIAGGQGWTDFRALQAASDGRILFAGHFTSRGTDFDPTEGEDIRHDNGAGDAFVSTWLCSDCDALLSHGLWAKPRGAIVSRVTTNLPAGRVKVQLTSDDGGITLSETARLRPDGRARTRFDGLSPGRYDVQIQWIEDENGARLCDGPLMERSAGVP
ncbi:MAG: hypothetical protein BroJett003_22980 [Planctomycetota bacterium]|nr:MAG: hypothetical protein BroJett003_22980 [Planctomycetota bacterium]